MQEQKVMISLELPNSLKELLRKKAFDERVTLSELIRRILSEELKKEEAKDVGQH